MGYGQHHALPPAPPKEKYALGLNIQELIWVIVGLSISYKLIGIVPPLPMIENFIFIKIHAFIPLMLCAVLAFGKHPKTGISIGSEIINFLIFKARNKILMYRRWEKD